MDKIVQVEIIKKFFIFIFVLIAIITLWSLVDDFLTKGIFLNTIDAHVTTIFLMVILAIVVKYLVDMAIVKLERQ